MAKQKKASLKSNVVDSTAIVVVKPVNKSNKNDSHKLAMGLVEQALAGAKTVYQSIMQLEPKVAAAAKAACNHASLYGDIRPCDKLVKGLGEVAGKGKSHRMMVSMQLEVIAWVRANSPIRWDSTGKCKLVKEGEPGFKPFKSEAFAEEAEGFHETEQAKEARAKADATHKNALEPITTIDLKNRIMGLRRWFKKAQEPDANGEVRGVKAGQKAKISSMITDIENAYYLASGEENPNGPLSEKGKKEAA